MGLVLMAGGGESFTPPEVVTVTIPASGWSASAPFSNRVAISKIRKEDNVDVSFQPTAGASNATNIAAWEAYANINYSITEDGSMVFYALENKPATDVKVAIKGFVQYKNEGLL